MSGRLVEQWPLMTIEEICKKIFAGGDKPKENFSKIKTDKYCIPIYSNGIKDKGLYGYTDVGKVNEPSLTISARGTIGYSEIREPNYLPIVRLIVLIPNTDIVMLKYLKYFLDSIDISNTGSSIPQLTVPMIRKYKIPIMPLEEQQRIVSILDEAFEQISNSENSTMANIANLHSFFENTRDKNLSGDGFDWPLKQLDEICSRFEYGSSAKSHAEGDVPVLRMGNMQNGEIDWSDLKYSSDSNEIEKYLLRTNDVLFNRTNSAEHVGKAAIYRGEREALFAGYLIRVHYDPELLNPEYLNYYLNGKSARDYGKSVMSKSINQANINATKLKQYSLHLPPIEIQDSIVNQLNDITVQTLSTASILRAKLSNLAELRKSILQEAFNGTLRIAEGLAGQS